MTSNVPFGGIPEPIRPGIENNLVGVDKVEHHGPIDGRRVGGEGYRIFDFIGSVDHHGWYYKRIAAGDDTRAVKK